MVESLNLPSFHLPIFTKIEHAILKRESEHQAKSWRESITQSLDPYIVPPPFPDHTQLPESDGTFVHNFYHHPQNILLTDSIAPVLERIHPDGQYAIGQDCGIYWRETEPPEKGAEAPDWFYVPNVPPNLDGEIRRSYVLWREYVSPLITLEFASGTGEEERDRTALNRSADEPRQKPGKFWVYEKIIKISYYGIYEIKTRNLEVYYLLRGYSYEKLEPNEHGHYPIIELGIELGLWQGSYQNQTQLWLRWWDDQGNLLLTGAERAELAQQRAETERQRTDRADRSQRESIPRLLGMGLTPEQVAEALNLTVEQVREMS